MKMALAQCARFPNRPRAGPVGTDRPEFADSTNFNLYRAMQCQGLLSIRRGPFQQVGTTVQNAASLT